METITGQLNTELNAPVSEQVVKYLLENGIITPDVILNIDNMNKKNAVLRSQRIQPTLKGEGLT